MTKRSFGWFGMTLLAFGVAVYAVAMLLAPEMRPPLIRTLFAERAAATLGHFTAGTIALVAGAFQTHSGLRARFIGAHRWLGRLYIFVIVVGGVAGLFMSFQSMGGPVAHVGFGLLAVCWIGSTLIAYRHIGNGSISAHRAWMIRSYALTLAAVTLRIYLPISQIAGISFVLAYPVIAWISWVPNLFAAEWFIRRPSSTIVSHAAMEAAQ